LLLELNDVHKSYAAPHDTIEIGVLHGLSLQVDDRQTLAILGPSGSGKTTLLNIMGTLDRPTRGRVFFEGQDVSFLSDRQLARMRNRRIGFVFQLHHLLPQCTLLENVLIPTLPSGPHGRGERGRIIDRAHSLLKRVGLGNLEQHRPGEISVGQRQRAAVVRALINRPAILLADEPTGSLDADTAQELGDLLVELNREELTALVVVTHDRSLASRMGTVFSLRNGKLGEPDTAR
jgi:ABC-type lipoprotein export system ATPase subunit